MQYETPPQVQAETNNSPATHYVSSDVEIQLPLHDTDVTLVLPSGEKVIVQYRTCNEHPSIDVCLPYDTCVINWKGDDMQPAPPPENGPPEVRVAKQLCIELKDQSVWVEESKPVEEIPAKQFYRTVLQVEVLSEDPFDITDLGAVNYAITDGDCSGQVEIVESETVTPNRMAELLTAQGSDPGFFGIETCACGNSLDNPEYVDCAKCREAEEQRRDEKHGLYGPDERNE